MAQNNPFGSFFSDPGQALSSLKDSIVRRTGSDPEKKHSGGSPAKKDDTKKLIWKAWDIATWCIVCAVVLLAVLLVGVRVVGLRPFCVLSGSMEPMYKTGSLIYVKKSAPEDIEIGDAITFVLNEDLVVATHQVYDADYEKGCFYTQGIANKDSEGNIMHDGAPVYFENLIGRPIFTIPYLGYVSDYLSHPPGIYVGISGALILLILFFLPDLLKLADESDKADAGDKAKEKKPFRTVPDESPRNFPARRYFPEYDPGYDGEDEEEYEEEEEEEEEEYDEEYESYDNDDGSIVIGGDDHDE